ncbi:hypothetical protein [Sphingomonas quercus]|uniref:PRC-barrel domain-containing protein n=1 Tax=Sphingomonas quercus TaxID=2842451 RepID=A0ABS6BFH8_9SPHN|nr:hypothetical protein [Sphingomonas quercus]MBU3076327.1 hypothetical protein [Sphingomonas quercus]
MRGFFYSTAAIVGALTATATVAQQPAAPAAAAPNVTQGASVFDVQGGTVGTIESVEGTNAVLATTKSKVKIPVSAFAQGDKGLLLGMTAEQVDAAAGAAAPQASAAPGPAKLEKGMAVNDAKGQPVGTIEEVESDFAVVATQKNKVRLPLTAFADAGNGPIIGMSAAELDAAAEAAKPKTGAN